MNAQFRWLTPIQQSVLAAGGWRDGDPVSGTLHHPKLLSASINGLVKRGLLTPCMPLGSAWAVPSHVAAAFRDHRARLITLRMRQDARRAEEGLA